ncbi:hypothetical protein HYT24_03005 [Candidatus Pacearchaeota archaeon]|nr:hypothetical protein [Candidatus Pacearchaeota archaeon]
MKIIFLCKYNAFRSRVAEYYFKKINRNRNIQVISRGLIMGGAPDRVQLDIVEKVLNINIGNRKSKPIKLKEMIESDMIIVVANDIPKVMFNYEPINLDKKLVFWNIKDEQLQNKENIKCIVLSIKEKVNQLNKKLEKK